MTSVYVIKEAVEQSKGKVGSFYATMTVLAVAFVLIVRFS